MDNKKGIISKSDYINFLREIKEKITSARVTAYRKLNRELISLYWDIGKLIFKRQQQFSWGRSVVEQLAKDLRKDYAGLEGFSARNLWNMRRFYIEYKDLKNLQQLVAEIPWGHKQANWCFKIQDNQKTT